MNPQTALASSHTKHTLRLAPQSLSQAARRRSHTPYVTRQITSHLLRFSISLRGPNGKLKLKAHTTFRSTFVPLTTLYYEPYGERRTEERKALNIFAADLCFTGSSLLGITYKRQTLALVFFKVKLMQFIKKMITIKALRARQQVINCFLT